MQRRVGEISECDINPTLSEGERKGALGISILDGCAVKKKKKNAQTRLLGVSVAKSAVRVILCLLEMGYLCIPSNSVTNCEDMWEE